MVTLLARRIAIGAGVAAVALIGRAHGQGLDLTPPAPTPALAELGVATRALGELQVTLERLRLARRAASGRQVPAVDAMIALRELAADMCRAAVRNGDGRGDGHGDGSGSGRADVDDWRTLDEALRLVEAAPTLDGQIRALLLEDDSSRDGDLVRFRAMVPAGDRAFPASERARALSTLLVALDPLAVPALLWPRVDATGTVIAPPPAPDRAALRNRLERLQAPAPLRDAMAVLLDDSPAAPPASSSPRTSYRLLVAAESMLDLLEVLASSTLVDRARREAFEAHALDVINALLGGASDEAAFTRAALQARETKETAALLRTADRSRPALGDASRALGGLPALLLRLDTQVAPDAQPPPWRSKRAVADLLKRIAEGRSLDVTVKVPELAEARRSLLFECRQMEKSLLDSLAALIEAPSPHADPAMASLLRGYQRLVEDLRWLGRIEELSTLLATLLATRQGATDQGLERSLNAQMTGIAVALADAARRPDAGQARIQLERQVESFSQLPGEEMPQRMLDLLGPERPALVQAAIAEARSDWVRAWAQGEGGGAAARRLLVALRLMRSADAVAALRDPQGLNAITAMLARWGGWSVPAAALQRAATEDTGDLLDALAALPTGGATPAMVRNTELATALPRLAVRLSQRLATVSGSATSPAAAALGPLVEAAPDDAWGAEHLDALARIALLTRAWLAAPDDERARSLRAALDAESDALLQRLGEWRGPIPTLR